MSKAEGRVALSRARQSGRTYARNQLESEHFADYVADQVYRANIDNLPRNKRGAMCVARSILTDLYNDIRGDLRHQDILRLSGAGWIDTYGQAYALRHYGIDASDAIEAFDQGVAEVLDRKNVTSWLADEILFRSRERIQGAA